jgi:hypothetical protein
MTTLPAKPRPLAASAAHDVVDEPRRPCIGRRTGQRRYRTGRWPAPTAAAEMRASASGQGVPAAKRRQARPELPLAARTSTLASAAMPMGHRSASKDAAGEPWLLPHGHPRRDPALGESSGASFGEWCNGSTTGSEPVSLGSNPSSPVFISHAPRGLRTRLERRLVRPHHTGSLTRRGACARGWNAGWCVHTTRVLSRAEGLASKQRHPNSSIEADGFCAAAVRAAAAQISRRRPAGGIGANAILRLNGGFSCFLARRAGQCASLLLK